MKKVIVLFFFLVLLAVGFVVYLKFSAIPFNNPGVSTTNESVNPQATSDPEGIVILNLIAGQVVTSPLSVTGLVPAGWMFEGRLPVLLLDDSENIITKVQGVELKPGSWQSGEPVAFKATVSFSTDRTEGYIVVKKDNPSGLPENDEEFRLQVSFKN